VVNRDLPRAGVHVILRQSMHKFDASYTAYKFVDILNKSTRSKVEIANFQSPSFLPLSKLRIILQAKLNAQSIRCLLARGVPTTYFSELFDSQFEVVLNAQNSIR
jgi:hypothetical protein